MTDLELARSTLSANGFAFVLVRESRIIATGAESGVVELLATLDRLGPDVRGASLADKIVGKAVALLVVAYGIAAVDAALASETAVAFCTAHGVPVQIGRRVPRIMNRRGDGPCPMEQLTSAFTSAPAGVAALRRFFAARDHA